MNPFTLTGQLDGSSPVLFASPHSGQWFPPGFLAAVRLPVPALRRLEDAHVGALLKDSTLLGIPLLEANHARAVIDLNRAESEYDPAMIAGALAPPPMDSERVRRGYGLFPRLAGTGQPIHGTRIAAAEARARIAELHRPWHATLAAGLAAARIRHGHAVLLDVHSMPRLDGLLPARVVLGDRQGSSASGVLVDWLDTAFTGLGLKVARNDPYAGGHTTALHGRPAAAVHAVQLEFDRTLYMDPVTLKPHDGFSELATLIKAVMAGLLAVLPELGLGGSLETPLAAE